MVVAVAARITIPVSVLMPLPVAAIPPLMVCAVATVAFGTELRPCTIGLPAAVAVFLNLLVQSDLRLLDATLALVHVAVIPVSILVLAISVILVLAVSDLRNRDTDK
ncbi:MAG: hypothetical protein ACHQJX_12315 [Candidatus Acidiferrales bacterium]|jgi:hypothetical protein